MLKTMFSSREVGARGLTKESGRTSGVLEALCERQSGVAGCSRAPPPVVGRVGGPLLRFCSAAEFADAWAQLAAAGGRGAERGGGGGGGLRVDEPSLVSGAPMGAAPRSERGRRPTSATDTPVPAPLRYRVMSAGESALARADSGVSD
jgi:hypothetical protein